MYREHGFGSGTEDQAHPRTVYEEALQSRLAAACKEARAVIAGQRPAMQPGLQSPAVRRPLCEEDVRRTGRELAQVQPPVARVLEQEPNHRVLRSSPSFKGLSHSIIISTKTRIICFRKLIKVSQAKKRSLTSHQRVVTKFKSRFRYHQLRNPQLTKARVCIQRSSQTISLSWTKLKVLIQSTHRVGKKLEVNSLFKVRVKFLKARK